LKRRLILRLNFKKFLYLFGIFLTYSLFFVQNFESLLSQLTEWFMELTIIIVDYLDLWKDFGPLQLVNLMSKIINSSIFLCGKLQFSNYLVVNQYLQSNVTYWHLICKSALNFLEFKFPFALFYIFFNRIYRIDYINNLQKDAFSSHHVTNAKCYTLLFLQNIINLLPILCLLSLNYLTQAPFQILGQDFSGFSNQHFLFYPGESFRVGIRRVKF